jgi:hypothetical protein
LKLHSTFFNRTVYPLLIAFLLVDISSGNQIDTTQNAERSFVIISDTQTPMWFEKLFVKTHHNAEATEILFNSIAKDTSVSSVFFLGDVTAMSSIDGNWEKIDSFLLQTRKNHASNYAAAGNHDYLLSSKNGENNLKKRFPEFIRTGYTVRQGTTAFILLNSNFSVLSDSEKTQQQKWYIEELQSLDNDSTIKIVVIGCHHSPFSNSSIVGHSQQVREIFVPPFLSSKKTGLFISGHSHTLEHFKDTIANKNFLVIGGGGGLLHTRSKERPGELQDLIPWQSDYRMFHYIIGNIDDKFLRLSVMMLNEDLTGPKPFYEIKIPVAN